MSFCSWSPTEYRRSRQRKGRRETTNVASRDPYPNSVRYHPWVSFYLMEQVFIQISDRKSEKYGAPSITTFEIPWTTPKVCSTADSPSSFVNWSNLSRASRILSFPNNIFENFSVIR